MRIDIGLVGAAVLAAAGAPAQASKPLWEAGIFAGGAWTPDYPAADENSWNGLPVPYVVYRGDVFRLGDGSLASARAVRTPRFDIDLSVTGSFSVESEDNEARRGMPDLDYLGEVGPAFLFRVTHPESDLRITAQLETRAVFSTDLRSLRYRGVAVNPKLRFAWGDEEKGLSGALSVGPQFGFDGLNAYFYQVDPAFAIAGRPAYDAEDGYIGTTATLSAGLQLSERLRLLCAVRAGYYAGSVNEESPLFRDDVNVGVFVGIAYRFWESYARVED